MANKYQMINWVDGMKIQKQHFVNLQHACNQQLMQGASAQLTPINYGLLPPVGQDAKPAYKLNVEVENTERIHVDIFNCEATTPAGFIIDIEENSGQPRHFSLPIPEEAKESEYENRYLLVLSAAPFDTVEVGEPNPQESPPRRPFVEPSYQLGLLPKQSPGMNQYGPYSLSIAEVIVHQSNIELNEEYIPPCMSAYSSALLIDAHTQFYHSLHKLETLCIQIIRKVVAKDQKYLLAEIVKELSHTILAYLETMLSSFNNALRYQPPIRTFECISSLARLIKNGINLHQGVGKEELINYFVEWCDLNQGEFEKVISQVVDHTYDHTAITETVGYCSRFLGVIVALYEKLDELDYIGRKSEKDIFVKEEKQEKKPKKKNRINFLAQ